jgi:hypothetical protein
MARCARRGCRRWRPGFVIRIAGLGLRLDDAWYCSAQCLGVAVRQRLEQTVPIVPPVVPTSTQPRLGGVLATQKRLAPSVVEQAASEQARTGLRIGTQLVELGLVTKLDVLRALAAQSGVGFLTALDPARLTHAPGNLSPAVVRALGVVPFEADRRHDVLKVACMAPVPRASLAALRELTGSIIEPYLVADDQWPAVLQAYGAARRAGAAGPVALTDLESLAERVAASAREAGAVRMSEARCEDSLWVRLESAGRVEELLLTSGDQAARPAARASVVAVEAMSMLAATASAEPIARPKRARTPRAAQPRPRRPRAVAAPEAVAVAAPRPAVVDSPAVAAGGLPPVAAGPPLPVPVLAATPPAQAAQVQERAAMDESLDLSFLEAWDSKAVPLFEQ